MYKIWGNKIYILNIDKIRFNRLIKSNNELQILKNHSFTLHLFENTKWFGFVEVNKLAICRGAENIGK